MATDCLDQIQGAAELSAWFGTFPSFHDANVVDFQLRADGNGAKAHLKVAAFRTTDKVDGSGYFILEKHCVVTLTFEEIVAIDLTDFMQGAIIFNLDINKTPDEFEVVIESSYGLCGSLKARQISIAFEPDRTP